MVTSILLHEGEFLAVVGVIHAVRMHKGGGGSIKSICHMYKGGGLTHLSTYTKSPFYHALLSLVMTFIGVLKSICND